MKCDAPAIGSCGVPRNPIVTPSESQLESKKVGSVGPYPADVLLATSFIAYFNQTALETTLTPFTNRQFNWHEVDVSILFAVAGIEITIVYIG
ncbi:unnamed protein product, partial [Adineta steineri]